MAGSLPPNNGSAQVLTFQKIRTKTMRELIATGVLNELEFGLLKGATKAGSSRSSNDRLLGWGVEEKGVLLNMEVDEIMARQGEMKLEVQVRSLCYSRGVTADYLENYERFNMKPCVLVLGDLGKGAAPWSELVQPAVYLHRKEFNIIWIDVPSFKSNPRQWMLFGAEIIRGLLKFLCIKQVAVISRGIGGAVFLEALSKAPDLFTRTHMIYNMDMPKGKGVQLPIFELEEVLRKRELQLWFAFRDDEKYDRSIDGTPMKSYDAIQKLQARLVGERQRGRRVLNYDEVLITEKLNENPRLEHANELNLSIFPILAFSNQFLESIAFFLEIAPGTHQDGMEGGLVGDFRALAHAEAMAGVENNNEPLAVRRTRIGHLHGLADRKFKAIRNKKRLDQVEKAAEEMRPALPDLQDGSHAGFPNELARRLGDGDPGSGSRSSSRSGSRIGTKDFLAASSKGSKDFASRNGTNSRNGSNSRTGTKEDYAPALPALLSSSSTPALQALANEAANSDSDDDGGLMGPLMKDYQERQKSTSEPWQDYRKIWQDMHRKAPTGYTHPMKEL